MRSVLLRGRVVVSRAVPRREDSGGYPREEPVEAMVEEEGGEGERRRRRKRWWWWGVGCLLVLEMLETRCSSSTEPHNKGRSTKCCAPDRSQTVDCMQ